MGILDVSKDDDPAIPMVTADATRTRTWSPQTRVIRVRDGIEFAGMGLSLQDHQTARSDAAKEQERNMPLLRSMIASNSQFVIERQISALTTARRANQSLACPALSDKISRFRRRANQK